MEKQTELLLSLAKSLELTGGVLRALAGEVEQPRVEKKETKKKETKKKETKKEAKEEEAESRSVFLSEDLPPAGPKEIKLFKKHWGELGKQGQAKYLAGECDSLGELLKAEEASDDFGGLDDMPQVSEDEWTLEEVRKEAQKYAKKHGKPAVVKIFKDHGYSKIADAQPENFDALMGALS